MKRKRKAEGGRRKEERQFSIFSLTPFFILAILCLIGALEGQETWEAHNPQGFTVQATVSKSEISLLDNVEITLQLSYPETYHPDFNAIRLHLLQHVGLFEAPFSLDSEQISPSEKDKDGFLKQKADFVLSPQYTGTHELSFFDIPFETQDAKEGKKVLLISNIMTVNVKNPENPPEIQNYEPPLLSLSPALPVDISPSNRMDLILNAAQAKAEAARNEQVFNEKSIPWLGMLALAAAFLFLVISIKSKGMMPEGKRSLKAIDPKKKALNDLNALQKQEDLSSDAFYATLTHILHEFLENYYHVKANTRTTEEFLHDMSVHPIFKPAEQSFLQDILVKADQVKFGHLPSSSRECTEILELTRRFIEQNMGFANLFSQSLTQDHPI